jgi:hypothetical protein
MPTQINPLGRPIERRKRRTDPITECKAAPRSTTFRLPAVDIARKNAMNDHSHGILVTQQGYTSYTVAISRDVPYGQTRERREQPAN